MTLPSTDSWQVNVTVLIESSRSFPEQDWEAVLWHNGHKNREWRELPLQEMPSGSNREPVSRSAAWVLVDHRG